MTNEARPRQRIYILGTTMLAGATLWDDLQSEIWATGGDMAHNRKRVNRWYEIHNLNDLINPKDERFQPWHLEHAQDLSLFDHSKIWAFEPHALISGANMIPRAEIEKKYGTTFLTCTPAWMLAHACYEKQHLGKVIDEIVILGCDMSCDEERRSQRDGMIHFQLLAEALGISVVYPAESDLAAELAKPAYPFHLETLLAKRLRFKKVEQMARREILTTEKKAHDDRSAVLHDELMRIEGSINEIDVLLNTWC